ncbi:MAG: methylated-DNA--[protein]-cysteine S-methyltransferase [Phycisphaerae bacterium]|nr:methylated-DNA--[protein]-cysteine S-methyltransferase [Phycisphaerae bacterium]
MGAVAGDEGIVRVVLPHYTRDDLAALLAWEHRPAEENRGPFEPLIARSREYFNAHRADFADIPCALPAAESFFGTVYRACRDVPYGATISYSALARQIGRPDAARAVATALSKNPMPLLVPCHRVTYADGRPGGFSAAGGEQLKRRLLEQERRSVPDSC